MEYIEAQITNPLKVRHFLSFLFVPMEMRRFCGAGYVPPGTLEQHLAD